MPKKGNTVDVVVHNDDITSMATVALMLTALFDKSDAEAEELTMKIHNEGQCIVGAYEERLARRKIELAKLMARGANCPLKLSVKGEDAACKGTDLPGSADVMPKGWYKSGTAPQDYVVKVQEGVAHSGTKCATMENAAAMPSGFGTLMSNFGPDDYAGKRLRMRMWVKTERDGSRVSPWMRVDGPQKGKSLAFDNWCERSIKGKSDWTECVSVLDVPDDATNIVFGVMLMGTGKFYLDDTSFEIVDKNVETTNCACYPKKPRNLNFEE